MANLYLYLDWIILILMSLTFCQQLFSKKFNFYGVLSILSLAIYIALHSYSTGLSIFVFVLFLGGIALIGLEMFIPGVGLYLFNRKMLNKKLAFLNQLVLNDAISTEEGYVASESRVDLIGKKLLAYTDLRPAGVAALNNEKFDVVTDGDFVEKGNEIEVIRVEGMRIVVKKI